MSSAPPPIPLLDLSREYALIREDVLAAIESVCSAQRFVNGREVAELEALVAEACGVAFAVGCASGTDALWLALTGLGIGQGDAVVTTPFSFFATVSSILRVGATPLLADIDHRTFNLAPAALEAALAQHENAAAIMPVHLYGQCADMDGFRALASQGRLKLIEDAAQAFGASFHGVRAGALGDAAAFSFYPTKNLSAFGDAGLMTTPHDDVADRARLMRAHGMRQRYFHEEVGWNSRLDTLQAAVLQVKLKRVAAGNQRRRQIAALYDELFLAAGLVGANTSEGIVLPYVDPRGEHVFHQYVVRASRRDALRAWLTERGIGSEVYYPLALHEQQSLAFLGYRRGDFPVSEKATQEVLALPMFPELRDDEVHTVVAAVRAFYA
jgi:dTDP-4-amino-4,6-dideoxygalactose transaminase